MQVIGAMPLVPETMLLQDSSVVFPTGHTTPKPVTTIRRDTNGFLEDPTLYI